MNFLVYQAKNEVETAGRRYNSLSLTRRYDDDATVIISCPIKRIDNSKARLTIKLLVDKIKQLKVNIFYMIILMIFV